MEQGHKEELKFPDFDKIIMHCKTIISLKFPKYGNSWIGKDYEFGTQALQMDNRFWQKRLQTEVDEFMKADSPENVEKELCDIINVCCMIYENTKWYRDPYWRYG